MAVNNPPAFREQLQRRAWRLSRTLFESAAPEEIARAAVLGFVAGSLQPGMGLVFLVAMLCRAWSLNLSAGLAGILTGYLLSIGMADVLHRLGHWVLICGPLVPAWTWLYNLPLVPWTGFHQTLVMGGLLAGLYLAFPVYVISKLLAQRWQSPVRAFVQTLPPRVQPWIVDPAPRKEARS